MPRGGGNRRGWGAATGGTRSLLKGPADYFAPDDWNARCDECYRKQKASAMFLRWDNCYVCDRCIEIRNPQDFVQGVPDNMTVPWARPTPQPTFVEGVTASGDQVAMGSETNMINGVMINGVMIG